MSKFQRTPEELRGHASYYWPTALVEKEAGTSVIPRLIETQDQFISILKTADAAPDAWKTALQSTSLHPNVFLKHLMVLADFGGEPLKRIRTELAGLFPNGEMTYVWQEKKYVYRFKAILQGRRLDNVCLRVDGANLLQGHPLDSNMEDVVMLLLHAATALMGTADQVDGDEAANSLPGILEERCMLGSLIGSPTALEKFVKERYIWVSRITGGASANAMGQLAQDYVVETLAADLPKWRITRNGTIPGMSQNAGATDMNFDVLAVSPKGKYVGIEVSFQFTTNSTIERKAGQANSRYALLKADGHHVAYVIDGAGNFERNAALTTISRFSDCTVAMTNDEFAVLAEFLRNVDPS